MKLLAPLILLVIFASCSSKNPPQPNISYPDTAITKVDADVSWYRNDYRTTTAVRIVDKKLLPDPKDSTRNIIQLDSLYFIPFFIAERDSAGKAQVDSLGQVKQTLEWRVIPKNLIEKDYNKRYPVDSIFQKSK